MNTINMPMAEIKNHFLKAAIPGVHTLEKISFDSRELSGTEWFFPLKGEKTDAHDFIPDIDREKKAAGIIFSRGNAPVNIPFIQVEDTNHFLLELALAFRLRRNPYVIGITGSNGKTTTKDIMAHLLRSGFGEESVHSTQKNFNNHFGVPYTILSMPETTRFLVLEMGMNHPGEISLLSRHSAPDVAIITSISEGHAEFFRNADEIAREKISILSGCRGEKKVIHHEDIHRRFPEEIKRASGQWMNPVKCMQNFNISILERRGGFVLVYGRGEYALGIHSSTQKENFLLALCALLSMDIIQQNAEILPEIFSQLDNIPLPQHRLQRVTSGPCEIWDDTYNANPDSFRRAIDFVSGRKKNRLYGIFGQMSELGDIAWERHFELGQTARKYGFQRVLFSSNNQEYRNAFREGWGKTPGCDTIPNDDEDIRRGVESLFPELTPEDILLLKGSRSARIERALDFLRN